jgi:hypothetical protein
MLSAMIAGSKAFFRSLFSPCGMLYEIFPRLKVFFAACLANGDRRSGHQPPDP